MGTAEKAIVEKAVEKAGGGATLARKLGLKRQAVYQWKLVPSKHVLKVEEISGIPRHKLRPDLYPEDREQTAEAAQ